MKIGIDPGLTGAIAFVHDNYIKLFDMPVMECKFSKKQIVDGHALMSLLAQVLSHKPMVSIELVHSMPKQGVVSTFTFGDSFGAVRGVVQAMGFDYKMVRPQAWKGKCQLLCKGKDASRQLALKMYPNLAEQLKFKYHHGRADAIFIAVS
jgi:crossover junction endodeoxyribonuclease RuvC